MFKIDATTVGSTEGPDYFGVNTRIATRKPRHEAISTRFVEEDKETGMVLKFLAIASIVTTMGYMYFSCFSHGISVVG